MKIIVCIILISLYSCTREKPIQKGKNEEIIIKTVDNGNFKATLFQKSTISDITVYVSLQIDHVKDTVFSGNFGKVIDIYSKECDTLYLKCYKPSSNIIYKYKHNVRGITVLKDTIITEQEYIEKTRNK